MLKPTGKPVGMITIALQKTYGLSWDDAADTMGAAVELILIDTLGNLLAESILALILAGAGKRSEDE